jgi:glycosyltransferase involved in cell wall biosynthesis
MSFTEFHQGERTIWVPSLGDTCGLSEYSTSLARHLPGVRLSATEPSMQSTRLLHVQHHSDLFDEMGLAEVLLSSRQRAAPPIAVITEHDVRPGLRAWEHHADALVSLTEAGAAEIAARCPKTYVQWIPHGCPPWTPARKERRNRTIGAFGFLNGYKGFWRLLEVIKEVRGTSLIAVSYPLKASLAAQWKRDIEGLPVTWIQEYLPEWRAAQMLAAEADILAFFYDDEPYLSASGAVRVGMATGVPVVTSTARWFAELGEAVYRADDPIDGVQRLLEDTSLRVRTIEAARAYCDAHSWPRTAARHLALWRELEGQLYMRI